MSGVGIQSHSLPQGHRLFLRSHIRQIEAAMEAILAGQPEAPWLRTWARTLALELAALHDLGKASEAFQRYIRAPDEWRGDPVEKAHTPLSLALTMAHSAARGWTDERALAAALAVRGHHGGQPASGDELHERLFDDATHAALLAQVASLDLGLVERETGVALAPWSSAGALLEDTRDHLEAKLELFRRRRLDAASEARFLARAAYAVLLEADKALLAVDGARARAYLSRERPSLPVARLDAFGAALSSTPMDALRAEAGALARAGLARHAAAPLLTLTLPTGSGKTLIAARWALEQRQPGATATTGAPTIIIALPMLSIVDQTESVWRAALAVGDGDAAQVMASHSLSDRQYDTEAHRGTADFYLDTWRSEVVITTFDQLLLAMFSDRARHAMRYHRLLNARIVLDEVQCVPPVLWEALSRGFAALTSQGSTRVLAMSATQPGCIDGAVECLDEPRALYHRLDRYRIELDVAGPVSLEGFAAQAVALCEEGAAAGERTLATLNTRASAQEVWAIVDEALRSRGMAAPMLLSGDLTPRHRLDVIRRVREGEVAAVVSTQCVEAGVDIDMDRVLRDFAPLDGLIQIAGRCNRHDRRSSPGRVVVRDVHGVAGRSESAMIYDPVLLHCTREVIVGRAVVDEREVYDLCAEWFRRVSESKSHGRKHFEDWARLRAAIDIQKLLRDEQREQITVVVIEQDPSLRAAWLGALDEPDRWERRSRLRQLASRVAAVSVSVPEWRGATLQTRALGGLTLLEPGQYHPVRGLISIRRP